MRLLWVSIQYISEAGTLEPRGSEVARAATVPEGMEETADVSIGWEVRGGILWSGFQAGWNKPPCRPHCAGEAHSTIEGWKSTSPRKPPLCLRGVPWLQAAGRSQAVFGRLIPFPGTWPREGLVLKFTWPR